MLDRNCWAVLLFSFSLLASRRQVAAAAATTWNHVDERGLRQALDSNGYTLVACKHVASCSISVIC